MLCICYEDILDNAYMLPVINNDDNNKEGDVNIDYMLCLELKHTGY